MHREIETEVCIVGGGVGGVAAALAVSRGGRRCVVVEPTDWIGGQFTSQGVPADENRWVEYEHGVPAATGSYMHFRDAVRQWYRDHRPLTDAARANVKLNPGNGWVSALCAEPRVAHAAIVEMLAPAVASGLVTILLEHEPTAADVDGDRVRAVTCASVGGGDEVTIRAAYFLDATELGDLLPLTGAGHHVGAEAISEYGEMHGHPTGDPNDQQSISWCFALEHRAGEDHTIARPERYDFWRDFMPQLSPPWPGRMLSWTVAGHDGAPPMTLAFKPPPQQPDPRELEWWRYRRIVDAANFTSGDHPDVALINMPQMDYFLGRALDVSRAQRDATFAGAREQSLAIVYWMQAEAPRFDGTDGVGFPGLRLRGDELGTADGFAKAPYIREARRLDAQFVVHEGHVGTEQRRRENRPNQDASPYGMGEPFADSVGVGHYRLDLHPSTGGRNTVFAQATPFRIPLGALLPKRLTNLIAAGKCLGVTHVTNGAYRLHPIEWNVGESAGALAAFCLDNGEPPAAVRNAPPRLREFQRELRRHEVPLAWPWERDAGLA